MVLGLLAQIGLAIMVLVQGQVPADAMLGFIGRLLGGLAISGPVAVIYLIGGSAMIRRTNLGAAKVAAVVGCIPCFNCLVLTPIGIWAAVLVFSDKAHRDFSN